MAFHRIDVPGCMRGANGNARSHACGHQRAAGRAGHGHAGRHRACIKEPQVEQATVTPVVIAPATAEPTITEPSATAPNRTPTAQNREITVDVPGDSALSSPEQTNSTVYSAFDFLRDYLTNRTYPTIVEGKPWTNSTVNFQQYPLELEGVTYWDFFSEHENWDSPSYLWQDDGGNWRPYEQTVIQNTTAYILLERQGPGAMDKLWFTQDAVWMLTTEQSKKDVGPIANMDEFVEWGNLEKLGNLRFDVDGRIVYDGLVRDWLSGKAWRLTPELTRILTWRHREFGSSGSILPVLYQKSLRVALYGGSKKPKWFLATGVRFPAHVAVKPYTGTAADLPPDEMTRLARNVSQPENYLNTLDNVRAFDLIVQPKSASALQFNGAGTVAALQFQIAKKDDPRQLWLRVKYGGQVAVNLPLIAFFGDQKEMVAHRSAPLGIVDSGDAFLFYSNLPLPFQNGMTIELTTNSSTPVAVSVRLVASRESAKTQLWVDYREPRKLAMYGENYRVQLKGDGKLVGLVLQT
ncbi:MAG: DUF2961 domain-containing protein, partial [Chloroflexi bacterium]|nr:DUF2961 domain-containing protein [Chloroflexota bacterium]